MRSSTREDLHRLNREHRLRSLTDEVVGSNHSSRSSLIPAVSHPIKGDPHSLHHKDSFRLTGRSGHPTSTKVLLPLLTRDSSHHRSKADRRSIHVDQPNPRHRDLRFLGVPLTEVAVLHLPVADRPSLVGGLPPSSTCTGKSSRLPHTCGKKALPVAHRSRESDPNTRVSPLGLRNTFAGLPLSRLKDTTLLHVLYMIQERRKSSPSDRSSKYKSTSFAVMVMDLHPTSHHQ